MTRVESRLANEFLEQLGNVNRRTARTVSIHLADFEQFVKREYCRHDMVQHVACENILKKPMISYSRIFVIKWC